MPTIAIGSSGSATTTGAVGVPATVSPSSSRR